MFEFDSKKIKIFTDGANLDSIIELAKDNLIDGITTNPTLMRKSGVTNYLKFAEAAVYHSNNKPISLEVLSDNFTEMVKQAKTISKLGESVFVKIPITNSKGVSTEEVIDELLKEGIKVNITAVLSLRQIDNCVKYFHEKNIGYISIFAGRIADTGLDPSKFINYSFDKLRSKKLEKIEIIWASTREIYNLYQAANCKCHIITIPPDILKKIKLFNYNLEKLSLETIQMFKSDSEKANYRID